MSDSSEVKVAKPPSKYKIVPSAQGFVVEAPDRTPTKVTCDGYKFGVISQKSIYGKSFGLFELRNIIAATVKELMMDWESPKKNTNKNCLWKIKKWACDRTGQALAKRIKNEWTRLLANCDDSVLAAQRSYFAATAKSSTALSDSDTYRKIDKYYLQDIIKYRAAAMTVDDQFYDFNHINPNWMKIYSGRNEPCGSLRKILMNLPGGIPYGILKQLSHFDEFKKPYLTRLELIAAIAAKQPCYNVINERTSVINRSNRTDIRKALSLVSKATHDTDVFRKFQKIWRALAYIFDYPDYHNGNIVGLAEKSIRWHRTAAYNTELSYLKNVPLDSKTALPPIPLPSAKSVEFLGDIRRVVEEGTVMSHCVATYAKRALHGQCYLFHVEYNGEAATVEVSPQGHVVQARGPHNSSNKATAYATRVLGKWGKGFLDYDQKELYLQTRYNDYPEVPF